MSYSYKAFKGEVEKQVLQLWKEVKAVLTEEKFAGKEESKQLLISLKKYLISKFAMAADQPRAALETDFIPTVIRKVSSNNFCWVYRDEWETKTEDQRKAEINNVPSTEDQRSIVQTDKLTGTQVASCIRGGLLISSNIGKHFKGTEMKQSSKSGKGYNRRKITLYKYTDYENIVKDMLSKQFIKWFNSLIGTDGHIKTRFTRPDEVRPVSWTVRDKQGQKQNIQLRDDILVKLLGVRRVIGRGFLGSIRVGVYSAGAKYVIFGCYGTLVEHAEYRNKFWHLKSAAKAEYDKVMVNASLD